MVKGISRQVIVVHSPDKRLFEQAIFILKDGQEGVTDEALLKEANRLINGSSRRRRYPIFPAGPIWACGGALLTAVVWFLSMVV